MSYILNSKIANLYNEVKCYYESNNNIHYTVKELNDEDGEYIEVSIFSYDSFIEDKISKFKTETNLNLSLLNNAFILNHPEWDDRFSYAEAEKKYRLNNHPCLNFEKFSSEVADVYYRLDNDLSKLFQKHFLTIKLYKNPTQEYVHGHSAWAFIKRPVNTSLTSIAGHHPYKYMDRYISNVVIPNFYYHLDDRYDLGDLKENKERNFTLILNHILELIKDCFRCLKTTLIEEESSYRKLGHVAEFVERHKDIVDLLKNKE